MDRSTIATKRVKKAPISRQTLGLFSALDFTQTFD